MRVLTTQPTWIEPLKFSPTGGELISATKEGHLLLWRFSEIDEAKFLFKNKSGFPLLGVSKAAFLSKGQIVAEIGLEGLCIFPPDGEDRKVSQTGIQSSDFFISSDGITIVSCTQEGIFSSAAESHGGFRKTWARSFDEDLRNYRVAAIHDPSMFISCETSNSKRGNSKLVLRNTANGEVISTVRCAYELPGKLLASPSGNLFFVSCRAAISIWRIDDWSVKPRKLVNENNKHFNDIACHPSGKWLAAASNDETVKVYDTSTLEIAKTFTWDIGKIRSIAFSPDGLLVAAGSDKGKIVIWDFDE